MALKEIHIETSRGLEAKRKTDRREDEIDRLFPPALYLLYRYPNISGLTSHTHIFFWYHGIFFSFLSEGSVALLSRKVKIYTFVFK